MLRRPPRREERAIIVQTPAPGNATKESRRGCKAERQTRRTFLTTESTGGTGYAARSARKIGLRDRHVPAVVPAIQGDLAVTSVQMQQTLSLISWPRGDDAFSRYVIGFLRPSAVVS